MKKLILSVLTFIVVLSSVSFADSILMDGPGANAVDVDATAKDILTPMYGHQTIDEVIAGIAHSTNDDYEEITSDLVEQIKNANTPIDYSYDEYIDDISTVKFGKYPQSDISGNTKEPIEWIVLEKNDEKALLLSKYVLDFKQYHRNRKYHNNHTNDITWGNCDLRKWLNADFYNSAFSNDEKQKILPTKNLTSHKDYGPPGQGILQDIEVNNFETVDLVFILCDEDIDKYFQSEGLFDFGGEGMQSASCVPASALCTNYYKAKPDSNYTSISKEDVDLYQGILGYERVDVTAYWLRNTNVEYSTYPLNGIEWTTYAESFWNGILINGGYKSIDDYIGVRPAIWVSLGNNSGNANNYEVANQTQANNIQETTKPFNAKYAEFSGNVVTYDQINWDDELTRKTLEGLGSLKKTTDENNQDAKETNQTQANNIHETIKPAPKNGWVGDYYYQNDVPLKNTWVDYGSDKYYCGPNGAILKNQWIDNTYYVDNTGKMLKNTTTPDGYKVGVDGKYITETNINVSETESIEQNSKNPTVLDNNFIIINEKTEELANKKLQSITKVNFDSKDIIMEITSLEFSGKVIVNVSSDNNWIKAEWNDKGSYWRAISNYKITNDDDKIIFLQEVNNYILNMHKNDTANDFNNLSNMKTHRTARIERLSKLGKESLFTISFAKSNISYLSAKQKKDGLFGLFGKEIYNVNFKYNGDMPNSDKIKNYNSSHNNAVIVDCFDKRIRKFESKGNNTYELEVYTKERADEIVDYINDGNTYIVYFYDRPNTKFSTHVATKRDKGFRFSKGHRRYTKEDGKEITNEWLETDKRKYYFDKNGDAVTGDVTIDDKTYLFDDSGSLKTEDANNGNYHYVIDPATYEVQETIDIHEYKKQTNPVLPEGAIEPVQGAIERVQGAIEPITDDTKSESKGSISKITDTPGAISGKFNNFMNNNQAKEAENVAKDFFDNYIKDKIVKGSEDWMFKREMAIIKWMVENCVYDWDSYNNGSIPNIDYSAYAALVNKKAVCSGFANGFAYLCEVCEIPVKYLRGVNHAWNMVKLDDGQWYHVDSTWSLCRSEYSNFTNLTDEECKNLINGAGGENNHASWDDTSNIADSDKYGHEYVIKYLNDTYGINDRYTGYITPKTNKTTVQ